MAKQPSSQQNFVRRERMKAALKANIAKRKTQQRERAQTKDSRPADGPHASHTDADHNKEG